MEGGNDTEESHALPGEPQGSARLTGRAGCAHLGERGHCLRAQNGEPPLFLPLVGLFLLFILPRLPPKLSLLMPRVTWWGTRDTVQPHMDLQFSPQKNFPRVLITCLCKVNLKDNLNKRNRHRRKEEVLLDENKVKQTLIFC